MKIQRKPRNIVSPCTTIKTTLPQNKALEYVKYRLPTVDNVPTDRYYSMIVHIETTTTYRSNKKAIAVYYDIAKFSDVYRKANKLFKKDDEKIKVLYIKQIYPLDSDAYPLFLKAMHEALYLSDEEDIDLMNCIGVTEWISLGYSNFSPIGGIQQRSPWEYEDFKYLYEEENSTVTSSDDGIGLECDEYGNII